MRGVEVRLLELAARDAQGQRRQVRAREMGRQVGRREGERVVENAHTMSIGTPAEAPYGGARAHPLEGCASGRDLPSLARPQRKGGSR